MNDPFLYLETCIFVLRSVPFYNLNNEICERNKSCMTAIIALAIFIIFMMDFLQMQKLKKGNICTRRRLTS